MVAPKFVPLVAKQVMRHRARSLLTVLGVATAVFLFVAIEAMQKGVATATRRSATDTTLVVYRKDRFCPFTSQLPEYYGARIATMAGVESAIPTKVVVSNCRASLDVVTFRGVPREAGIQAVMPRAEIIAGSTRDWTRRSDAAVLGETLARRRGLKVGDTFESSGVTAYVAAIARSPEPQDRNVAYVHLDFLQQSTDGKLGIVTQFAVKVSSPQKIDEVAKRIDEVFGPAESPTTTRPEKTFVAQAAKDMVDLVSFARILGWGCLLAILALIGNAIVLSVQGKVKEHAVLQTLGFSGGLVGRLVVAEGILLGLTGGALGTLAATMLIRWTRFSMSVDGLSIPIEATPGVGLTGIAVSLALAVLSGLFPAWQVSRQEIATCFRAV